MTGHRRILICLLCVTALLFAAGASARGDSPENKVPWSVESKARRLMHDLRKQGFEVSRGYFKLWTTDDCAYTFDRMGLCYGNNPAGPYVTFAVPPWPEEFVDPADSSVWGPSKANYNDVYRLDPREGILILGQLPPPASFFSEQTWLFTRQGTYDKTSDTYKNIEAGLPFLLRVFFATVPGNSERVQAFSSLSNPINNVVIERKSGAAFDQIRYFIITPDRFMDKAVRKALAGISVKDHDVFTEPIPSNMKVGLDAASDDFTTLFRYVHPKDGGAQGTASDTWRNEPPLVVLRVRDVRSHRKPQRYEPVELERRTAVDERTLQDDLGSLLEAIGRRWGQPCNNADCSDKAMRFVDLQRSPIYMVGPLCIPIGENCLGDNWDASYHIFGPMSFDNGEIYAVAGTLGTKTGNATYTAIGINQRSLLKGVANIFDEILEDTANEYAGGVSNTDKFYLNYFTRDCSGLEYLTDGHCFPLPETMIPQGDQAVISMRNYIKPGTQRGPDSALVLPSMVLKLKRP